MSHGTEHLMSLETEQAVLGALLRFPDSVDRIPMVSEDHFASADHKSILSEFMRQSNLGLNVDALTVGDALKTKVTDALKYCGQLASSCVSSSRIEHHFGIIREKANKRALEAISKEIGLKVHSIEESGSIVDYIGSKIDSITQGQLTKEPKRMSETLSSFADLMEKRLDGTCKNKVSTGHVDLDKKLKGGLSRGTLTVLAGRPAMGKTAAGLGLCRNVSEYGTSLFLSMEMTTEEVNDRNVAAIARLPLDWVESPSGDNSNWTRLSHAFAKASEMNMYIDDQTGLNMSMIRAKARQVKRKSGLDLLVVDQLSFITGAQSEKAWEATGEHTRGLLQVAKELDIAVLLLCQLNRECEKRNDKRPIMADLAMSGSIEQDANTIIFLYRDEIYHPDTHDKGICEWIVRKARQGQPGTVALTYIGEQTRFEDCANWKPQVHEEKQYKRRGLAEML